MRKSISRELYLGTRLGIRLLVLRKILENVNHDGRREWSSNPHRVSSSYPKFKSIVCVCVRV